MLNRRQLLKTGAGLAAMTALPLPAFAADGFHGFDPRNVGAERPSADELKAMVAEAMKTTPPKNGKNYVFGYTMWGGSSPFSQLNRQGLKRLAADAGIDLLVADNEWDPQRNVANVQSFVSRDVDFVVNSLLDIHFAAAVRDPLQKAGIPLIALDIPVPGAEWVGVNNARAGYHAGAYLAQAALKRWDDKAKDATLVIASFPEVGPNGKLRNMAEEAGTRSVLKDLPDDRVIWLDMKGTADSGYTQMNNLLGRLPSDKPILIASFSDEQLAGALRAVKVANRSDQTLAVGMGGERLDAVAADPSFIATMSFYPERYANTALPVALMMLAGVDVPKSVFAYSGLVTPATVCKADKSLDCTDLPDWQPENVEIDETAFGSFVDSLYSNETFKTYKMLLPPRQS